MTRVWTPTILLLVAGGMLAMGRASTGAAVAIDEADARPFAPIAYFQQSCANCHGDYGTAYGAGFGAGLTDDALRQFVDEMAAGPGFAPLQEKQLDIQTAYHRSMIDGKPFVIAWREGEGLRGEVTPGATVSVGGVPATVEGHVWHSAATGDINATLDETTTTLKAPAKGATAHSHHDPVAPESADEHD